MSKGTHERLMQRLAELDPAQPSAVAKVQRLLREASPLERLLTAPAGHSASRTSFRANPRRSRRRLAAICIVSTALLAALALLGSSAFAPSRVSAAVSFTRDDGYIVAKVIEPYAGVAKLRREFARYGLKIKLELLPVSPGSVGRVFYIGSSGESHGKQIEVLEQRPSECVGGGCSIGLRIPTSYSASADITIGRPARRGEPYDSSPPSGSFAPGEPLHCSGLLGAHVSALLPVLREKGLSVVHHVRVGGRMRVVRWRLLSGATGLVGVPSSDYVWGVTPVAPGEVSVSTNAHPLSGLLARLAASMKRACEG